MSPKARSVGGRAHRGRFRLLGLLFLAMASSRGLAGQPDPGDHGKADDAVRRALLSATPQPANIFAIRQRLAGDLKGTLKPHIVANFGHQNPEGGTGSVKYMVFETYEGPPDIKAGELFFGYFLEPGRDQTVRVSPGFVELIAWDRTKNAYNFWELTSRWFYRGDSNDVLADVSRINLEMPSPQFAAKPRLRCSGCHTLGTPIMKELDAPHNDWWTTTRKLNLGPFKLQPGSKPLDAANVAAAAFRDAADASDLRQQVIDGIGRVLAAREKTASSDWTLKHQLRSLMATMEMNFVTDDVPFSDASRAFVALPSEFFVDRRLLSGAPPIRVDKTVYRQALDKVGSRYAPPRFIETHHAFIVPAVSEVDRRVIDSLRTRKLVDDELVADVLAVDFTTPVFSRRRAALIKFFPETASNADALRGSVITALKKAPEQDRAAGELLANLTDAQRTAEAHCRAVQAYLDACNRAAGQLDVVVGWLSIASQRRLELVRAETAQHPEGNIKEEGFRRIFPTDKLTPKTGALRLDPGTCRAVSAQ